MSMQSTMEKKLNAAFSPERLEVVNESHLHAGHHHLEDGRDAEFDGKGETHFRIRIMARQFAGMSRLERHRAVNAVFEDVLQGDLHALAIETAAPGETVPW